MEARGGLDRRLHGCMLAEVDIAAPLVEAHSTVMQLFRLHHVMMMLAIAAVDKDACKQQQ